MQKPDTQITAFHRRLHAWYKSCGRTHLPWRNTADAYAIYVSEIMLQQTQVATVLDRYYHPFLQQFPTLESLAKAPRQQVLKAWQGLGYYNRAAHLHEAAIRSKGSLPSSVDELLQLPGIGRNTAHAVAAFAFRRPVAVMEANVKRVLCRIFALKEAAPEMLWQKADTLLDRENPFDYNQAMMDLGSMVCRRRAPLCGECPASPLCKGKTSPMDYPAATKRKPVAVRRRAIVLFTNGKGQIYATPRKGRFLTGLYHFVEIPRGETTAKLGNKTYSLKEAQKLSSIRQQYSHFTLEADIYRIAASGTGANWHSVSKLHSLPVSGAEQKILALLGR